MGGSYQLERIRHKHFKIESDYVGLFSAEIKTLISRVIGGTFCPGDINDCDISYRVLYTSLVSNIAKMFVICLLYDTRQLGLPIN